MIIKKYQKCHFCFDLIEGLSPIISFSFATIFSIFGDFFRKWWDNAYWLYCAEPQNQYF